MYKTNYHSIIATIITILSLFVISIIICIFIYFTIEDNIQYYFDNPSLLFESLKALIFLIPVFVIFLLLILFTMLRYLILINRKLDKDRIVKIIKYISDDNIGTSDTEQ
ncbi:hypothetical protein R4J03_07015 [Brachyspira intermedia]|uniref:hypothetical protein n=1 Tax=Brachyspira intermedia TaxID=84377 RepID=UPI0026140ADA|nr:hypothetical protein [uncultured Brachyspira sp.]